MNNDFDPAAVVTPERAAWQAFGIHDYLDAFQQGKDLDAIIAVLTKHTAIQDPALYGNETAAYSFCNLL